MKAVTAMIVILAVLQLPAQDDLGREEIMNVYQSMEDFLQCDEFSELVDAALAMPYEEAQPYFLQQFHRKYTSVVLGEGFSSFEKFKELEKEIVIQGRDIELLQIAEGMNYTLEQRLNHPEAEYSSDN